MRHAAGCPSLHPLSHAHSHNDSTSRDPAQPLPKLRVLSLADNPDIGCGTLSLAACIYASCCVQLSAIALTRSPIRCRFGSKTAA